MVLPGISVVTPVYNAQRYLEECIDSVLVQRFQNWELILVNDGSKDDSGAICDEYARRDARIRVIHKENAGPTAARTDGAAAATADYITFLDSDDKLAPTLLEKIADILPMHGPDAVLYDIQRFGADESLYMRTLMAPGIYRGNDMEQVRKNLILSENDELAIFYGVCGKVFRREMYLSYQKQVPDTLFIGEDLAVIAPLLARCDSVFVSDFCGYFYRDTPGSLMNSFRPRDISQISELAAYLEKAMGTAYQSRIDAYVVMHLFDYLDRAVAAAEGYGAYHALAAAAFAPEFLPYLQRGVCASPRGMNQLAFFLTKHRMFRLIWLLRHIKTRNHE